MTNYNRDRAIRVASVASSLLLAAGLLVHVSAQDATPPTAKAAVAIALPSAAPEGAIVLFGGKTEDLADNWYRRGTKDQPPWSVQDGAMSPWTLQGGAMTPAKADVTSKAEFGDCYLHVEFRPTVDAQGKTRGHGNAGVGLQGRYEIQIMDSFGAQPEAHGCGSFYSQKPPRVNACKKPGEWQSFDIIFRAPRLDAEGKVVEKARATVFQNGVLIHANEEFNGPTGIQYGEFKGEAATGPIVLQGDHDPVQFRNIWVVPL